jgi:hypothetical protein
MLRTRQNLEKTRNLTGVLNIERVFKLPKISFQPPSGPAKGVVLSELLLCKDTPSILNPDDRLLEEYGFEIIRLADHRIYLPLLCFSTFILIVLILVGRRKCRESIFPIL